MEPFLQKLAETLDVWSDDGRATLTETDQALAVNGLGSSDAVELSAMCRSLGWTIAIDDAGGGEIAVVDLAPDFGPFRALVEKPHSLAGASKFITNAAFTAHLLDGKVADIVRLVRCSQAFETATTRFCPYDDITVFEPRKIAAKARRVVRETGTRRVVAEEMGLWLLRDTERMPWQDHAFARWRDLATMNTMRALSNEVEQGHLVFRGPPLIRLGLDACYEGSLDEAQFRSLENAASWVYDNERELEMRHGLYAAEIARTAAFGSDAFSVFRLASAPALESARIAYGLNLSQVSRDTLKALADLRKAISDETAKLAESTRSVAGSVAAALFAGLGLLVTRSTTNIPGWLLVSLSVILAAYVWAVVWSGKKFIKVQGRIRDQWRSRLYAFLPQDEYLAMVETPAKEAEDAFRFAARCGLAISIMLVIGTIVYVYVVTPQISTTTRGAGSPVSDGSRPNVPAVPSGQQGGGTRDPSGPPTSPILAEPIGPSSRPIVVTPQPGNQ